MSKIRQLALSNADQIRTLAYDYPSGYGVPEHSHREHQLLFAARGVMTVRTSAGEWVVPPLRGVWIPAGIRHAIRMSGQVLMRTLYAPQGCPGDVPRACLVLHVSPLLRELILHVVARGRLDLREPADARLWGVTADLMRPVDQVALHLPWPEDQRAAKLATHLASHPDDTLPLAQLAKRCGASARTIERIFQAETGLSLGRWRQQLRLTNALRGLAEGKPVSVVAVECGYSTPSAFIGAFRATFGRSPGRYFEPKE